jgi:hypothetical protein
MSTPQVTAEEIPPIAPGGICDRCHAAHALVRIATGVGYLDMCGHDFTANQTALTSAGFVWRDFRPAVA